MNKISKIPFFRGPFFQDFRQIVFVVYFFYGKKYQKYSILFRPMVVWKYCFEKSFSGIFCMAESEFEIKMSKFAEFQSMDPENWQNCRITEFMNYRDLVKLPNYQNFIKLTYWNFVKLPGKITITLAPIFDHGFWIFYINQKKSKFKSKKIEIRIFLPVFPGIFFPEDHFSGIPKPLTIDFVWKA